MNEDNRIPIGHKKHETEETTPHQYLMILKAKKEFKELYDNAVETKERLGSEPPPEEYSIYKKEFNKMEEAYKKLEEQIETTKKSEDYKEFSKKIRKEIEKIEIIINEFKKPRFPEIDKDNPMFE